MYYDYILVTALDISVLDTEGCTRAYHIFKGLNKKQLIEEKSSRKRLWHINGNKSFTGMLESHNSFMG